MNFNNKNRKENKLLNYIGIRVKNQALNNKAVDFSKNNSVTKPVYIVKKKVYKLNDPNTIDGDNNIIG